MKCTKHIVMLFVLILIQLSQHAVAQNLDSLKKILQFAKHDSVRVRILVELSDECEIEDMGIYTSQAITICENKLKTVSIKDPQRLIYLKYLAAAYNNVGYLADQHGEVNRALLFYNKSLKIQEIIGDKQGIAYSLNNMGYVYNNLNDIYKALELFHSCLNIQEQINDKYGIAVTLINIGNIYKDNGNVPKSIEYFERALKIKKEINDKEGIAISLLNLGSIYFDRGESSKALKFFEEGLKNYTEVNDKNGIAYSLMNIGHIKEQNGELSKALEYFNQSLLIQEETEDKAGMVRSMNYIAHVVYKLGDLKKSQVYSEKALKLAKELGYPEPIKYVSEILSKVYFKNGQYKEAYEAHVLYMQMSDSLKSINNKKLAIQKNLQYEYDKKSAADSVKVANERKVFEVKMQQEKTQRLALYAVLGLIILFSGFIYNRFRVTRKQKYIIESQKVEVEQQRELADNRRVIAEEQKYIIEQKQKEILDSIHYAKRIQQAMLASEEYIVQYFKAETFIFYQPKDIVSGDFYWALSHHGKFYLAAGDCTGHGVPGAFMSLLNISFLNGNVIERGLKTPNQILNKQRDEIIKALNPNGNENSKDGMDCALCAFDLNNNKLEFALANNPLWLVRNNELIEYKADKMPVGMYEEVQKDFTLHSLNIQKGDTIYLLTDGYADQFGGDKGKKFKYKHLKDVLLANAHKTMEGQKQILSDTINTWKGNLEQVDDILIIGIRV